MTSEWQTSRACHSDACANCGLQIDRTFGSWVIVRQMSSVVVPILGSVLAREQRCATTDYCSTACAVEALTTVVDQG